MRNLIIQFKKKIGIKSLSSNTVGTYILFFVILLKFELLTYVLCILYECIFDVFNNRKKIIYDKHYLKFSSLTTNQEISI